MPRPAGQAAIDPNWEIFRRRGAIPLVEEAERLTSNWLRAAEAPDVIRYFESTGAIEDRLLDSVLEDFPYPCAKQGSGIITFAEQSEVDTAFASAGRFKLKHDTHPQVGIRNSPVARPDLSKQYADWVNMITCLAKQEVKL